MRSTLPIEHRQKRATLESDVERYLRMGGKVHTLQGPPEKAPGKRLVWGQTGGIDL